MKFPRVITRFSAIALLGLIAAPTLSQAAPAVVPVTSASVACNHCGTVTQVTARHQRGKGSGLGMIAGAVVGGVVGNQIGRGSGNTIATVGGAVAGGAVGNEIEKNSKKSTVFVTRIRMDTGKVREFTLGQQYAVGARVAVEGGQVHARP